MAADKNSSQRDQTVHYVSARQKRAKERPPPVMQPPLTPMIDVVFQLLLFFLVSTHFIEQEGQIQAKVPPRVDKPVTVRKIPLTIVLNRMGSGVGGVEISIEDRMGTIGGFKELYGTLYGIIREKGADPSRPVIIKPAFDVPWEHAVNAFNQATRARYKSVTFELTGG